MVDISFVISSYSRFEYIKQLVLSCRSACTEIEFEIVIVASDSKDSDKVKWLLDQPDVRLLALADRPPRSKRTKSLYYYENLGIIAAKGQFVTVMNDDMEIDKNFIDEFLSLRDNLDVMLIPTHIGNRSLGVRVPIIGSTSKPSEDQKDLYLMDFTIIRSTVYKEIGYLDENLDWYGKGLDLSLRIEFETTSRVGLFSYSSMNHWIAEESRTVVSAKKDFKYLDRKWRTFATENPGVQINYW
jgi:GT2 family glycosyltransferase